jgi:hypothetical protein
MHRRVKSKNIPDYVPEKSLKVVYCEGRVNIASVLKKGLHKTLNLASAIIIMTFFCN